jgi:putative transposase
MTRAAIALLSAACAFAMAVSATPAAEQPANEEAAAEEDETKQAEVTVTVHSIDSLPSVRYPLSMSRIARLVVPGLPHHVTQRGNGRGRVFFSDDDCRLYRDLLAESCQAAGVACWAYALMPSHIHAILVPSDEDGLRAALAPVHRRYAGIVNGRRRKTGHFWQGRYGAAVMDEAHLAAAFRYILRNPVAAGLAATPEGWRWSSANSYLKGRDDGLTETGPMLQRFPDMRLLLKSEASSFDELTVRDDETVGRPRGDAKFLKALERRTKRDLAPQKRGPKPVKKQGN